MSANTARPGGGGGVARHVDLVDLPSAAGDPHTQYLHNPGRAGGQTAFGGTAASDELTLRGTSNANLGLVNVDSPMILGAIEAAAALSTFNVSATAASIISGFYAGGAFMIAPVIDLQTGFFSWSGFEISPEITSNAAISFATFRLIQATPHLIGTSDPSGNPMGCEIINGAPLYEQPTAASRSILFSRGLRWGPNLQATISGATLGGGNQTGLENNPSATAVSGATVNIGNVRAVWCRNVGGSGSGTRTLGVYIGLDFDDIAYGGDVTKAVVRSALTPASSAYFLLNTGGAQSDFGDAEILNIGRANVSGAINLDADTPAQIVANTNNYAIGTPPVARLATDASRNVTGIVAPTAGDTKTIINVGVFPLVLTHEDAASTAANRIISPTGIAYTLGANDSCELWYDGTSSRWRILHGTGA